MRPRTRALGLLTGLLLGLGGTLFGLAGTASAQVGQGGTLERLIMPLEGGLAHYSSHDRAGGNDDFVTIEPGEMRTLVDHDGPGVIRRWWITIAPRNDPEIQRGLIVRCYWDGEESPSVEVPVSDFFGMGFGEWKDFVSLPLAMTSGGYNSYWPMPFRRGAREGEWGGDAQLWWVEARPGDRLSLPLEAPAAGTYEVIGLFTRAGDYGGDYGIVRLYLDGRPLEPLVDGFEGRVAPSGPVSFGRVPLRAGTNELAVELLGKDARSGGYSDGYLVGIDGFVLREAGRR